MTVFFLGVFEIAGWIFFLWKHHNLHFFFWFAQALWWAHCHIFHNTQLHYQCLEKSCKWSKGMFVPRFSDLLKQPFPSQFFHTRNQWLYHLNVPRKFNFFLTELRFLLTFKHACAWRLTVFSYFFDLCSMYRLKLHLSLRWKVLFPYFLFDLLQIFF